MNPNQALAVLGMLGDLRFAVESLSVELSTVRAELDQVRAERDELLGHPADERGC